MFLKDDGAEFNIKDSWNVNRNQNDKEKSSENASLSSNNTNNINNLNKKGSKGSEKDLNSILNNAGKLAVGKNSLDNLLDDKLAKNIVKNLIQENNIKPVNVKSYSKKTEQIDKLLSDNTPPPTTYGNKKPPAKGELDLMSSMASRLKQLEATCHNQREELKEKMKTINQLNEELNLHKLLGNNDDLEEIKKIKDQNQKYKKQISEMESFLKDYGLKWVGETNAQEGEFNIEDVKKELECAKPLYKNNLPKEIDMNVIIRRIDELNIIMEKDGSHEVFKDKDGAYRIKKLEPLVIGYYKNGLVIQGFPFYPYSSKEAQVLFFKNHQILEDILDGYFPLMLKKKFPNGVFFKVVDKIDEIYAPSKKNKMGDFTTIDEDCLKPLNKEDFLKQFPKNYIKNGKVVSVRDEIAKKIDGQPQQKEENIQKNSDLSTFKDGVIELESETLKTKKDYSNISTLKIRTEDGKKTMILKLLPTETMKIVYEMIIPFSDDKKFELLSNFQKKTYSRDSQDNLEVLGLHPNAALQMNPIKN